MARHHHRRMPLIAGCLVAVWLLTGCMPGIAMNPEHVPVTQDSAASVEPLPASTLAASAIRPSPTISDLGPTRSASIPADTAQVVVVSAAAEDSTRNLVSRWERTSTGWQRIGVPVTAHNGHQGWSSDRRDGDGTSPIGTFTLTSAAGRRADPGTLLPYEQDKTYYQTHGTFMGGDLRGSFEYVVAIDFNRVPGAPVSDQRRPDGAKYGGGVWFHVDHDSPTQACISIPLDDMRVLLKWLDPAKKPLVVMGPESYVGA